MIELIRSIYTQEEAGTDFPSLRRKGGVAQATERRAGVVTIMLYKTK